MIYAGIDPGLSGAVAIMYSTHVVFFDAPTTLVNAKSSRRTYEPALMANIIKGLYEDYRKKDIHVAVERQQAMPKQGVSSTFSTGYGFGLWVGILASLGVPYTVVEPRAWKKWAMSGMGKDKGASIIRASQLYPKSVDDLKRKKDHNRADALLIADYIKHMRGDV